MTKCYAGSDRQLEQTATIGLPPEFAEVTTTGKVHLAAVGAQSHEARLLPLIQSRVQLTFSQGMSRSTGN